MKRLLLLLHILVAGGGVGVGAAVAVAKLGGPVKPQVSKSEETAFVPTGAILAPLVLSDGRLSGYVSIEVQLEVPADKTEFVTQRLPLLLHAINLKTFRTPLAAGPDGMLPNVEGFRRLVQTAAPEAFGAGVVRQVAITQARPS